MPMSAVDVFDVGSLHDNGSPDGRWYKQQTTGDIPKGRLDFCLATAVASDESSYNM